MEMQIECKHFFLNTQENYSFYFSKNYQIKLQNVIFFLAESIYLHPTLIAM